jgi:hypothetical protein
VRTGVSQVADDGQGRSNAFLATSSQAVQTGRAILRASSEDSRTVKVLRRLGLTLTVLPD